MRCIHLFISVNNLQILFFFCSFVLSIVVWRASDEKRKTLTSAIPVRQIIDCFSVFVLCAFCVGWLFYFDGAGSFVTVFLRSEDKASHMIAFTSFLLSFSSWAAILWIPNSTFHCLPYIFLFALLYICRMSSAANGENSMSICGRINNKWWLCCLENFKWPFVTILNAAWLLCVS